MLGAHAQKGYYTPEDKLEILEMTNGNHVRVSVDPILVGPVVLKPRGDAEVLHFSGIMKCV